MTKETNNTSENKQKDFTSEEIEENRKKALEFYKKQTELLIAQAEYEKLMADIEQSRAKRMEMIIRQAQMQAGPEKSEKEEIKERSLKKD